VPLPSFPALVALVYQLAVSPSYTLPGAPADVQTIYLHVDYNGRALLANHKAECYMDSSVGENSFVMNIDNGVLRLVATPAKLPNPCLSAYDSGMITTLGISLCQYCYYEARIQLPKGSGLWPAFWLLSVGNKGAYVGAIGAFENPQGPNTGAPSASGHV
jgi:beta-glucanase (GH16 family)